MREGLRRDIEMEYEAQRAANRAEEARRLADATRADPMIGALVADRLRLFGDSARRALDRPAEAQAISTTLSTRVAAIQTELRDRLTAAGFDADYLQPVYACDICHDTGYVGEPIHERCSCFARRMRAHAARRPGEGLDIGETFERYDKTVYADPYQGKMEKLRTFCETYADTFPGGERLNLLMFGMSGLGKTYLLNCIGNRVHQRGGEVLKVTAYQLTERMRASIFARDEQAFAELLQVPLLLLDDLGVEPTIPNVTIEQLFTLLNERSLSRLHTVISTNLQLDELTRRYTERVCSRMFDRQRTAVLAFEGTDVRLRRGP